VPTEKRQRKREGRQARLEELRRQQKRRQQRRQALIGVIVVAAIAGVIALTTRGSGAKKTKVTSTAPTTAPSTATTTPPTTVPKGPPLACPPADGSAAKTQSFPAAPPDCLGTGKTYKATVQTDIGTFKVTFDSAAAPKTVNNFVYLARYHFYDDVTFHRVIPGFVVQGGDPQGTGAGGPGYQFADELPKAGAYKLGSLAMANSGPNTNGSQFFVITGDQGVKLPPSYSLFGDVTEGMDVVKKIEADGDPSGTPKVVHRMVKVTIEES
jgi:cyclophilin family peptidyl-prolyl cis-trans isomerase